MPADSNLSGRCALVTGASSGLGAATARELAAEGVNVALAARRQSLLREVADGIEDDHGVDTVVVPTDVREEEAVIEMVESTTAEFGQLDIVVNNAGLSCGGPLGEITTEEFMTMIETNICGAFFTAREAVPHLRESAGNLIFIGSFSGERVYPRSPVYGATRWWTRAFAHNVEADVGEDGVAVTVINPSAMRTPAQGDKYDEGTVLEPETVAETVVFAARQNELTTVSELSVYRRDKLASPDLPEPDR